MTYATLICLLIAVVVTTLVNADIEVSGSLRFDVAEESRVERLFQVFIETFGRKYDNVSEHLYRRSIFQDNLQYIEEHNRQFAQGKYSYTLGVNAFTDLKHEEFVMLYTSRIENVKMASTSEMVVQNDTKVPEAIDWRTYDYVTPVKDQKTCGSCWAFSATGSLEGQHAKNSGKLVSLSEQQLVDCSDNYGCNGGTMDTAFKYIMKAGGIESEQDYPYTATKGECKFNRSLVKVHVYDYKDVTQNEESLKTAVGSVGPVSVAVDASHRSFQSYNSGIYDEPNCSSISLDHGMLVVGYGTSTADFWVVKNSWGTGWGIQGGYIQMSRNKKNQCGIATMASYPITS